MNILYGFVQCECDFVIFVPVQANAIVEIRLWLRDVCCNNIVGWDCWEASGRSKIGCFVVRKPIRNMCLMCIWHDASLYFVCIKSQGLLGNCSRNMRYWWNYTFLRLVTPVFRTLLTVAAVKLCVYCHVTGWIHICLGGNLLS